METNELTKPDSFIETELQRFETNFEITKEGLIALADSVKNLVINGPDDKAGLKAVIEGRKLLKSKRVFIEKKAKETRESAVRFQKAVIQRETEYVSLLEPTEDILSGREEWYYAENARLDALKEKQESDRIQAMIDKLNAVRHAVDFHELKALTDVQFESLLAEATIKYNADLKAEQDEQQRQYELRLQEETRLAQAQKEQEERERKFKEEQEQFRIQQEEAQRKVNAENERIRKEQEAKDLELKKRQDEVATKEHDLMMAAKKEREAKEEAERKKQEEINRKLKEKEDKKQLLLFGEDSDRFAFLAQQIDVQFLRSQVWGAFKSDKGCEYANQIQEWLRLAYTLAHQNASDNKAVPVIGDKVDD